MNALPRFANYQEEKTDNGYETLQDFFLSWTIRCSAEKYKNIDEKLQEYSRKIVYAMIFGENISDDYSINNNISNEFKVLEVTTKRQEEDIDLLAKIKATVNGESKKYLLNIENKWYSALRAGQLEKYRDYTQKNYSDYEIINLFITCDEERKEYEEEKERCRKNNYKYLTIGHLQKLAEMKKFGKTNNYLFDEYWFE